MWLYWHVRWFCFVMLWASTLWFNICLGTKLDSIVPHSFTCKCQIKETLIKYEKTVRFHVCYMFLLLESITLLLTVLSFVWSCRLSNNKAKKILGHQPFLLECQSQLQVEILQTLHHPVLLCNFNNNNNNNSFIFVKYRV